MFGELKVKAKLLHLFFFPLTNRQKLLAKPKRTLNVDEKKSQTLLQHF